MASMRGFFSAKPIIVLEIGVLIFLGVHVGKEIIKRRAIENEIAKLAAEISDLETKKTTLATLLEYTKTDAFVESEVRSSLNLAKQGESVVVIPDVDANAADTQADAVMPEPVADAEQSEAREKNSNVALWWDYFFQHP